jgi:hypothetical protein
MKKIMVILFILTTTLVFSQVEDDFNVILTNDGDGVVIEKYIGKSTIIHIPNTIQGIPVKEIGDYAFYGLTHSDLEFPSKKIKRQGITDIFIPEGVVKIGRSAFAHSSGRPDTYTPSSLNSIIIPDSVTEIGSEAFQGMTLLTDIHIPASLKITGGRIFYGCNNLKNVIITNGVKIIGDNMFQGCTSLTSINIPESVISIGYGAFNGSGLTSLEIPISIVVIPARIATHCEKLTTITLPESILEIEQEAFSFCPVLTTVIIPESVEKINFGEHVFGGCPKFALASQAKVRKLGYGGNDFSGFAQ